MKVSDRYKDAFERAKDSPAFWTETALLDVARQLLGRMKELGISQRSLAERMGRKAPYINRMLSGKHNVTVETLCTAAHSMGMRIEVRLEPLRKSTATESLTSASESSVRGIARRASPLRLMKFDPVEGTLTGASLEPMRKAA